MGMDLVFELVSVQYTRKILRIDAKRYQLTLCHNGPPRLPAYEGYPVILEQS